MRLSLLPRDRTFYDLFETQGRLIVEAAERLHDALAQPATVAEAQPAIRDLEHRCDEVTHELVDHLNRTFVTPFDREDIYSLAAGLDDILDLVDQVIDIVQLYGITTIPAAATEMADLVRQATRALQEGVSKLRTLPKFQEHGIEVHRLENLGDTCSRRAIAELFSGSHAAVEVIKLKDLYNSLEDALDRCEDVANVIETITIKNG